MLILPILYLLHFDGSEEENAIGISLPGESFALERFKGLTQLYESYKV